MPRMRISDLAGPAAMHKEKITKELNEKKKKRRERSEIEHTSRNEKLNGIKVEK